MLIERAVREPTYTRATEQSRKKVIGQAERVFETGPEGPELED